MSVSSPPLVGLRHLFADELPELAVPWTAAAAPQPHLVVLNEVLAAELGLDVETMRGEDGLELMTGHVLPPGATAVAQAYAGHQFGGYNPRLGDGRALLLGELTTPGGTLLDLSLKGSGRTPFARGGDGLAALGPMLREHVVSEAMHALGIPTTRSLGVVSTGRAVQREVPLPGAVLTRVAASHLRVGSFQLARASDDVALLARLADHAIDRHHPAARENEQPYLALFEAVVAAQAALVARWMLVGFVHGVLNTDNVTISGETIDYGPCAFLDAYDPQSVFSSIDEGGRYRYAHQPAVTQWNLARLAEALLPLLPGEQAAAVEVATAALGRFPTAYTDAWVRGMRDKLGLGGDVDATVVRELGEDFLAVLESGHVDLTRAFRALGSAARGDLEPLRGQVLDLPVLDGWLDRWTSLAPDAARTEAANPLYVPRNHLVEEALAAATDGDLDPLHRLLKAVGSPFEERPGLQRYAAPAPVDFTATYRTFCGT